jgi:membrane-associated phospholipid phosphatase
MTLFQSVIQSSPITIPVAIAIETVAFWDKRGLIFLIGLILVTLSTPILKHFIFQPLYNNYGTVKNNMHYLGILGQGERPIGHKNCKSFNNDNDNDNGNYNGKSSKSKNDKYFSYGMPSGHAQLAGFVVAFILIYLYRNYNNYHNHNRDNSHNNYLQNILIICGLIAFFICVAYNRIVVQKCHTIQHIIVGGLIGAIMAIIYYYIMRKYIE